MPENLEKKSWANIIAHNLLFRILFCFFIALTTLFNAKCQSNHSLSLFGDGPFADSTKIWISYKFQGKTLRDSTYIIGTKFSFTFKKLDIVRVSLSVQNQRGYKLLIIEDSAYVKLDSIAPYKSVVFNSLINQEYDQNNNLLREIQDSLSNAARSLPPDTAKYNFFVRQQLAYKLNYIKSNATKIISLFYFEDILGYLTFEEKSSLLNLLSTTFSGHQLFVYLNNEQEKVRMMSSGNNWTINQIQLLNNKRFDIRQLTTKYLLLNYWGTWCGPCIAEIPDLVNIYGKTSRDSLEVISIAWERDEVSTEILLKFSSSRNMKWLHSVSYQTKADFNNPLITKIGISVFPTNILVNLKTMKIEWLGIGNDSINELYRFFKIDK